MVCFLSRTTKNSISYLPSLELGSARYMENGVKISCVASL